MITLNLLQILKNNANILYAKYIKKDDIETLPIFYIGGSQTLPPPLSPTEEEDAIKKLANGNLETRQLLVERNLRLVVATDTIVSVWSNWKCVCNHCVFRHTSDIFWNNCKGHIINSNGICSI